MSKADSTPARASGKTQKSNKQSPNFPLFAHVDGVGEEDPRQTPLLRPVGRPRRASKRYPAVMDALHAGRKPREAGEGNAVKEPANLFLQTKQAVIDTGELTRRSWQDYKDARDLLVEKLGKGDRSQTSAWSTSPRCGRRWSEKDGARSRSGTSSGAPGSCSSSSSTTGSSIGRSVTDRISNAPRGKPSASTVRRRDRSSSPPPRSAPGALESTR
jgi:hypothetical protein